MPSQGLTLSHTPLYSLTRSHMPFQVLVLSLFPPTLFHILTCFLHDPACPWHMLSYPCTLLHSLTCTCTSFTPWARHHTPLHTLECPPMPLHTHMDCTLLCPHTSHAHLLSHILANPHTPLPGLNILTLPCTLSYSHMPSHTPATLAQPHTSFMPRCPRLLSYSHTYLRQLHTSSHALAYPNTSLPQPNMTSQMPLHPFHSLCLLTHCQMLSHVLTHPHAPCIP